MGNMRNGVSRLLASAALISATAVPGIALAGPSYDELLDGMSADELETLHGEVFERLHEAWEGESQKPREILTIPLEDESVVFSIEESGDALSYRFTINDTSQLLDALAYFGFVEAPTGEVDRDPCENVFFTLDTSEGALHTYVDGTYTGEARGLASTIKVTVTVKDGKIADVQAEGQETEGIGSKALEQLPGLIEKANGTEGVDGVSGATITSTAILTATQEALANAEAGKGADDADEDDASASAAVDRASSVAEPADAIGENDASADEDEPDASVAYVDGVYEGVGKGIGGNVPVTVTVEGGRITEVTVGDNSETQGIGSKAIEQLPGLIVEANGIEGVDAVSGATVTSKAIFSAFEEALAGAAY